VYSSQVDEQIKLNTMLRWGVAFSIVWLAGLGSLIALSAGLRARRAIHANPNLHGIGRAWWCIIAGSVGVAILSIVIVIGVYNVFSN